MINFNWDVPEHIKAKSWENVDFCIERVREYSGNLDFIGSNVMKNERFIQEFLPGIIIDNMGLPEAKWFTSKELQEFFIKNPIHPYYNSYYDKLSNIMSYDMTYKARDYIETLSFKDFFNKSSKCNFIKYMSKSEITKLSNEEFDVLWKQEPEILDFDVIDKLNVGNILDVLTHHLKTGAIDYKIRQSTRIRNLMKQVPVEERINFWKNNDGNYEFMLAIPYPGADILRNNLFLLDKSDNFAPQFVKELGADFNKFLLDTKIDADTKKNIISRLSDAAYKKLINDHKNPDTVVTYGGLRCDCLDQRKPDFWYTDLVVENYLKRYAQCREPYMQKRIAEYLEFAENVVKVIAHNPVVYEFVPDIIKKHPDIIRMLVFSGKTDLDIYQNKDLCIAALDQGLSTSIKLQVLAKVEPQIWDDIEFLRFAMKKVDNNEFAIEILPEKVQRYLSFFSKQSSYLDFINSQYEKEVIAKTIGDNHQSSKAMKI